LQKIRDSGDAVGLRRVHHAGCELENPPGIAGGKESSVSETYHEGHRLLQERFDTRRLADRIDERLVDDLIDADDKAFIESLDMFFLATADEQGHPNCSYKGGEPGFVRVVDQHTVAFPNYDGNGMYCRPAMY
jgi:hypothetical protein